MEITVESPSKLRLQFNRNWSGVGRDSGAIDAPVESSPIFEIGEDQPSVSIKDGKVFSILSGFSEFSFVSPRERQ
jgi:hypothetical protein